MSASLAATEELVEALASCLNKRRVAKRAKKEAKDPKRIAAAAYAESLSVVEQAFAKATKADLKEQAPPDARTERMETMAKRYGGRFVSVKK